MTANTVILATSAQRDEYKRDFLTCLASPDGHMVAFSYKKMWFDPALLPDHLVGRRATIVFCDPRGSEFEFLAVRHVRIEKLVPASPEDLLDTTPITVVFQLCSLTNVTDAKLPELRTDWQASLGAIDQRPRPPASPLSSANALFVFEHPTLAEADGAPDQRTSWRVLSEELGRCTTLSDAFFFRVGALRKADDPECELASEVHGSLLHVYPLKPSSEYELPMDAYSTSGKTPYSDAIDAMSSSDQLTIQAITQTTAGRASEAVLVLRAGEVKRTQTATLIIQGAKGFEHLVPRVELATRIKPNLGLAALLTAVIAVGVVLGGLPKDALGLSDPPLYALKILGGLIVGASTLFALGRVPGVGK